MDEDAGVKAPVTRLRRRLSVEQTEESKSPAINTPTKKRGGRRAKPDLELIDENTPENTNSRRTKKTAVKEITDNVEEKVVTPSRRNTRIKSNTSIVSETALAVGSPRAKRAARRASQVGSDSEAPPTPIRQSRRTRKDSASSVETAETIPLSKPVLQITEVIVEEPENNGRKSINNSEKEDNSSPSSTRKSPRLANKKSTQNDNDPTKATKEKSQNTPPKKTKSKKSIDASIPNQEISESKLMQKDKKEHTSELSTSGLNLIKELDVVVTKLKAENLNKSDLTIKKHDKEKRKRTKSWTTLTVSNERNYYSDNEFSKKKIEEKIDLLPLNKSGSKLKAETSMQDKSDISFSKSKKKDKNNLVEKNGSVNMSKNESIKKKNNDNINLSSLTSENNVSELFEKEPSEYMQTTVYIEEDSDSNAEKNTQKRHDNEDQCVPVVKHPDEIQKIDNQLNLISKEKDNHLKECKENSLVNNSCEPMDVDETIPENLLLEMQSSEVGSPKTNSISKFSQESNISRKESLNKSKRKSSISQNPDNSKNENKSTLILSQLKDSSSNDINIEAKSPQIKNDILSKTSEILNITQENDIKKNSSLNCVTTSTPLQQKNIQKLALQVNTSSITANENSNDVEDSVKQKTKNIKVDDNENSSDESDSEVPDPGSSNKGAELSENNIKPKTKDSNKNKLKVLDEKHEKSLDKKGNMTINNTIDSDDSSKSDIEKVSNNERESSVENNLKSSKMKKNMSITFEDEADSENDSSDEMESDDELRKTNSLLDDKAIDAGDDYSSGDSQDESEREYEQQNQILERGETLTSDEDFSDDTDYEKDSFVVSSAEEDNDLLDGSEGDLSMSDNELKMTAKSKKKFNERKLKEQKQASKEMFEARHKLNNSKSDIKTKRNKRQQLSSSESEDESEIKLGVTRHNRMRLNSTNESSMLDDVPEKKISKKKTKRLSESICEENINEMEISITNETLKESDPLSADVQVEPKTQRNSSIAFINSDDINDDDKNELTKTQTEIIDPLDDSSDSDTENIKQNYDSILENLNKTNKRKPKTVDTSLNLDKKMKKQKSALVDELNLTQLKSAKKDKNKKTKENICPKKENQEDGESSDSIDLHLLFSEDSNNSEDVIDKKQDKGNEEEFIPLKSTDARTNTKEDEDNLIEAGHTSLNNSLKKKKKRKSNIEESINSSETETNGVSFFIDTEGTHALKNKSHNISLNKSHNISLNKSHNTSLNKKKKFEEDDDLDSPDPDEAASYKTNLSLNKSLNKSLPHTPASAKKDSSKVEIKVSPANDSDSDAPVEVSFVKEKRNTEVQATEAIGEDVADKSINKSNAATPVSEKKKKKKAKDLQVTEPEQIEAPAETSLNISLSSGKQKKNKQSHGTPSKEIEAPAETSLNISLSSGQKKKNKQSHGTPAKELEDATNVSLNVSKSKKKNKSINETLDTSKSEIESVNVSKIKTPNSHKKTKEAVHNESENSEVMSENTKSKKRKRNPSLNVSIENTEIGQGADINTSKDINESIVSSQKKKRKTSLQNGNHSAVEQTQEDILTFSDKKETKTKNQSQCSNQDDVPAENNKRKRNKRKEREDDEDITTTKVSKNSFDIHVPRLPAGILSQLDERPNKSNIAKKARVISTTQFLVEESIKRKNKPSNYLEESVYLDDEETEKKKQKKRLLKPKVLPFVPTAITSDAGYTTNFKVNVLPKEVKFVAQSSNISNFKNEFLYKNKVRRQGTYELYKKNRTVKMSKF